MERADIMAAMGDLKLYGMRAAYDELMAVAVRRQHEPRQIVGDLLAAEINEKKARSVKWEYPKLCVSDRAHAVFRYGQASKRPANIMAS